MNENIDIPDFSGDDFANDKEIQKVRAAIKAQEKMKKDAMTLIREELNCKYPICQTVSFRVFS